MYKNLFGRSRKISAPSATFANVLSIALCAAVLYNVVFISRGGTASAATIRPYDGVASIFDAPAANDTPSAEQPVNEPATNAGAAAVLPAQSDAQSSCPDGSILNIVAHEDDDILFMNPDIDQDIAAGMCVRTVYTTAGDDGKPADYWIQREQGPAAAYAAMAGTSDTWNNSVLQLGHGTLQMQTLAGNPRVSLVYMRLPDGNLRGEGFESTGHQSLQKLRTGEISSITTVDSSVTYTAQTLIAELGDIMTATQPTAINTQAYSAAGFDGADHADHEATGYFTAQAVQIYHHSLLHQFLGYQTNSLPADLTTDQIAAKRNAFMAYTPDDRMICNTELCPDGDPTYIGYFSRQYEQPNTRLLTQ